MGSHDNPTQARRRFGDRARHAVVIGRWGTDTALLRTEDGTTLEAAVPKALRELVDVGTTAAVSPDGEVVWHTVDKPEDAAPKP
jgi:hypothetical protein